MGRKSAWNRISVLLPVAIATTLLMLRLPWLLRLPYRWPEDWTRAPGLVTVLSVLAISGTGAAISGTLLARRRRGPTP